MDKVKFDKREIREPSWTEMNGFYVKNYISYAEKDQMARELFEMTTAVNDEDEVCYRMSNYDMIYVYLVMKYYSNVDVSESAPEDVYDWICSIGLCRTLFHNLDTNAVEDMALSLFDAAMDVYGSVNSLPYMFKHQIGPMLESVNKIDTTISESHELNNTLVELMDVARKQEDKKPTVTSHGQILNLAKRK